MYFVDSISYLADWEFCMRFVLVKKDLVLHAELEAVNKQIMFNFIKRILDGSFTHYYFKNLEVLFIPSRFKGSKAKPSRLIFIQNDIIIQACLNDNIIKQLQQARDYFL